MNRVLLNEKFSAFHYCNLFFEFALVDVRWLDQVVVVREREVGKLQIVLDCQK